MKYSIITTLGGRLKSTSRSLPLIHFLETPKARGQNEKVSSVPYLGSFLFVMTLKKY